MTKKLTSIQKLAWQCVTYFIHYRVQLFILVNSNFEFGQYILKLLFTGE